jgi:hypothetical protein
MPMNKLLIAVVLLAALSGAVYWSNKKQAAEDAKPSKDAAPKLVTLTDDQINQVEIQKKDGDDVVLQKNASGKWTMAKPQQWPVDQDASAPIVTAFTGLTWDRLIEDKPADLSQYGLANPHLRVTATGKNGKSQSLLLGDDTPTGGGTFAKLENDPRVFSLSSATKSSFDKSAQDLRDKRLLTFDSDKLSRIEVATKGTTFEIGKNNQNEWQIIKPASYRADSFQVEELVRRLKEAKMDPTAGKAPAARTLATIKVTDASGTQQLEVRKTATDYYAKSNVVDGFYKIPNDVGDAIVRGVDEYRNKKIFDFGFNELKRIDVRVESKSYSFVKSGEKWQAGGKDVDSVGVQSLIDKLRDLAATEFSNKPLGAVTDDLSVTTAANRTERVHIAKSGDNIFAQRENEPTVYKVSAEAVHGIENAAADVKPAPAPAKK